MHTQTNGMVERFNGRIEDVLQSHRFQSGEDLEQTILRYVHLYNSQLPQSALSPSLDRGMARRLQSLSPAHEPRRPHPAGVPQQVGKGPNPE
jgi:transposase InsO family protein